MFTTDEITKYGVPLYGHLAMLMLAALVNRAGGELRITPRDFEAAEGLLLFQDRNLDTFDCVLKVVRPDD